MSSHKVYDGLKLLIHCVIAHELEFEYSVLEITLRIPMDAQLITNDYTPPDLPCLLQQGVIDPFNLFCLFWDDGIAFLPTCTCQYYAKPPVSVICTPRLYCGKIDAYGTGYLSDYSTFLVTCRGRGSL